jgi:hypothetical protein
MMEEKKKKTFSSTNVAGKIGYLLQKTETRSMPLLIKVE